MYTIVHAIIILGSEDIINTAVNHELIIIVGIVAALLLCITYMAVTIYIGKMYHACFRSLHDFQVYYLYCNIQLLCYLIV